jgi:hypothetical protein
LFLEPHLAELLVHVAPEQKRRDTERHEDDEPEEAGSNPLTLVTWRSRQYLKQLNRPHVAVPDPSRSSNIR